MTVHKEIIVNLVKRQIQTWKKCYIVYKISNNTIYMYIVMSTNHHQESLLSPATKQCYYVSSLLPLLLFTITTLRLLHYYQYNYCNTYFLFLRLLCKETVFFVVWIKSYVYMLTQSKMYETCTRVPHRVLQVLPYT